MVADKEHGYMLNTFLLYLYDIYTPSIYHFVVHAFI